MGADERHSCSADEADQLQAIADQQVANEASSIAEAQYWTNVAKMSVLWTAATFGTYLLSYLNKYLPGTIFLNTYFDGIAGLIAYSVGKDLYAYFKLKVSFISSLTLAFVFTVFLYLLRIEAIPPNWITYLGSPASDFEPGSPDDNEFHLQKQVPWIAFFIKLGYHLTLCFATLASCEASMFPLLKRATAIGICNFVSRLVAIFAPLAAELEKPLPTLCLLVVNMTALLISLTFPSRQAELLRQQQILRGAAQAQDDFDAEFHRHHPDAKHDRTPLLNEKVE